MEGVSGGPHEREHNRLGDPGLDVLPPPCVREEPKEAPDLGAVDLQPESPAEESPMRVESGLEVLADPPKRDLHPVHRGAKRASGDLLPNGRRFHVRRALQRRSYRFPESSRTAGACGYLYFSGEISTAMAGPWTARRFLIIGLPFLAVGLVILALEYVWGFDLELVSLPLLLVGLFLLFEGYSAWRRSRSDATDNPK